MDGKVRHNLRGRRIPCESRKEKGVGREVDERTVQRMQK